MEILLLGGTGAMGVPLVNLLSGRKDVTLYVTSRSVKESKGNVNYIKGNAKDYSFLESLLNKRYDAIIDFLVYASEDFKKRLPFILEHTDQYFFFSSARCYAEYSGLITEESPRLVDVCKDEVYLATDEYGLAKGREENILRSCVSKNWTIIRPYITYNSNRIQLGVYEKENWLKRALEGRTVVFPSDIADSITSLTYGPDVAKVITLLIGNEKAYGETFHITTDETHTWREICEFYVSEIENLNTYYTQKIAECSKSQLIVADRFPLIYLANDYSLECFKPFSGCSSETDASFNKILELSSKVDEYGLKYVIVLEKSNTDIAKSVINNTSSKNQEILYINSLQSVTSKDIDNGITYLNAMKNNLDVIIKALSN